MHFWVSCSFKNRCKFQQYLFRFLQAFNALCKWFFERLPVHSGEYSHNLTANFCGGTERTPPHPTQRVNVSVCILEGTMFPCITDSVLFPFYFFYYSFRNTSCRSCGLVVGAWAGSGCLLIPFPILSNSLIVPAKHQDDITVKGHFLISIFVVFSF